MSEQKQDGVVKLVDAGVPADQGLSSLGLLMQLAGNLFAAYAGLLAFAMLFALRGSGETLWVLVLLGASITRSIFHRNAGTQLLYGAPSLTADGSNQRLAGIKRYFIAALIQTVIVGVLLAGKFHVPGKFVVSIMLGLGVWPVTLAILMMLPRFQRYGDDLPLPEDKGFEGAAILMTVLGLCGLIGTGAVLVFTLDMPGKTLTKGPGVLIALALAMLVFRSILHVQAGLSGLRETSVDRSVELANRYANFGVISSFCGGGALLMFFMTSAMNVVFLAIVCGLCWMLMAWPLVIRRFFSDRQFADLLAGDGAPLHRRAPDAGLTSLGWLLLAWAAFSATFLIPQIVLGTDSDFGRLQDLMAFGGGGLTRSMWFSVGLVVLQAWAGFELIRMSPHSRVIATVYGVVGAIVTVYINWPMFDLLKHMRGIDPNQVMLFGPLAMALIIPVATVVLVNRKIAPTARARFRQNPYVTPPSQPA
jgi:hypothetical protein